MAVEAHRRGARPGNRRRLGRFCGLDYARTLRGWHTAFNARLPEVRALGFDDRFIRRWNYYLLYCAAAFAMRNISVVQATYTRPNNPLLR